MSVVTAGHATASGTWGQATPAVFGSGVQDTTPNARFTSVSCGSAGNCTAVGQFRNKIVPINIFDLCHH